MSKGDILKDYLEEIEAEYWRAANMYHPFNTAHEGYAIILEELDELWDEIKKKHPDKNKLTEEVTQVASMALRFLIDICAKEAV